MPKTSLPDHANEMSSKHFNSSEQRFSTQETFLSSRLLIATAIAIMQLVALLGMLWISHINSLRIIQIHSENSLKQIVQSASLGLKGFLEVESSTAKLLEVQLNALSVDSFGQHELLRAMRNTVNAVPGLHGAMIGKSDGSFVFIRKHGKKQLERFARIISPNRSQQTDFIIPNDGTTIQTIEDLEKYKHTQINDEQLIFNIAHRPWYTNALNTPGQLRWTDPYIFASSQKPGITASIQLQAYQNIKPILAIDIELLQLRKYIDSVSRIPGSVAFIVDQQGYTVASSHPNWKEKEVTTLSDLKEPVLNELYEESKILKEYSSNLVFGQEEHHSIKVEGKSYFVYMKSVDLQSDLNWVIGVYTPTERLVSDVRKRDKQEKMYITLVIFLISLFTWALIFSGLRPLAQVERQATIDELTGLLNRHMILAQLSYETENTYQDIIGIVIFDLDGFKEVNDRFGHEEGDQVLRCMGNRLLQHIHTNETIGRLGGDEFVLLIRADSARTIKERVYHILKIIIKDPMSVGEGNKHYLGATAGVSFCQPQQQISEEELLKQADLALIRGKQIQKGQVWVNGEEHPYSPN